MSVIDHLEDLYIAGLKASPLVISAVALAGAEGSCSPSNWVAWDELSNAMIKSLLLQIKMSGKLGKRLLAKNVK
jgi:uncharacterized membrane protein